jgi:hypothetical protein
MLPTRHGELIDICWVHRYSIVLISNQYRKPAVLVDWKKMIPLIAAAVRNPLRPPIGLAIVLQTFCAQHFGPLGS